MSKAQKQFLYGFCFILIIGGIFWFFYHLFNKPLEPTCFDNILNQGEEKIDCGGPCESCSNFPDRQEELKVNSVGFRTIGDLNFFVFAEVLNPNKLYEASNFAYEFRAYSGSGDLVKVLSGEGSVLPEESKIFYAAGADIAASSIKKVEMRILGDGAYWKKPQDSKYFDVVLVGEPKVFLDGDVIFVSGKIKNKGFSSVGEVKILADFRDSSGVSRFLVAGTTVSDLRGLSERDFAIAIPYQEGLYNQIVELKDKLKILLYSAS